jgi:hypothetical protein
MAQMRICFIGDSFVSGAFDDECMGWVGRISASARRRKHDVSPYNLGVRGETSIQIARRWRAEAEMRQSPQQEGRLVFEFGVNDAREVNGKRQMEAAQSLAAAREILGAAVGWKPTLMIGPPPGGDSAQSAGEGAVGGDGALMRRASPALLRFVHAARGLTDLHPEHESRRRNPSQRGRPCRMGAPD